MLFGLSVDNWILLVGLLITIVQLGRIKSQHKDNHEWNRKKATFELLEKIRSTPHKELIYDFMKNKDNGETITKVEIENAMDDQEFETALGYILNLYESAAIGCYEGVYEHEILKLSRYDSLKKLFECFKPWITSKRKKDADIYCYIEKLLLHWDSTKSKTTPDDKKLG